jgi:hypothetical protein
MAREFDSLAPAMKGIRVPRTEANGDLMPMVDPAMQVKACQYG